MFPFVDFLNCFLIVYLIFVIVFDVFWDLSTCSVFFVVGCAVVQASAVRDADNRRKTCATRG